MISAGARKLHRAFPAIALVALAVISTGCGGRLHALLARRRGATSPKLVTSVLSVPRGGWQGSPVGSVRVLVPANGGRVSWGPQGLIALSIFDHVVNGTRFPNIYVMSPDGARKRCLTCGNPVVPHVSDDVPVWDPTGQFIVFEGLDPGLGPLPARLAQGGAGFDNNLWAITPNGRRAYQLTHVTRGEAVLHPQFSQNGSRLTWAGYDHLGGAGRGEWDIHLANFVVSPAGVPSLTGESIARPGPATPATFYETHVLTASGVVIFSSNLASPYESSCRGCALGIWSWNPSSSSGPRLLTPDTSVWNEHAALAPGGHIAWVSSQGESFTPSSSWALTLRTDWWMMRADGSAKRRITYFNTSALGSTRVICADSSWNQAGTELVGTVDVISRTGSTTAVVLLDMRSPQ